MKTFKELREGLFTKTKKLTAKEIALKNKAPKVVVDTRKNPEDSESQVTRDDRKEKQDWKFGA